MGVERVDAPHHEDHSDDDPVDPRTPIIDSEQAGTDSLPVDPDAGLFNPFDEAHGYRVKFIMKIASVFCIFWFLANVGFNYSLSMTSVASNTVLSTTSSLWTFILGILVLGQKFE
eukprot:gene18186-814_t